MITDDYLNQLSKELMLPRQLVSHHLVQNKEPKHSESEHELSKNNNYFMQNKPNHKNDNKQNMQKVRKTS